MTERFNGDRVPRRKSNFSRREIRKQFGLDGYDGSPNGKAAKGKRKGFNPNDEVEALLRGELPLAAEVPALPIVQPKPIFRLPEEHEIFGGPDEILSNDDFPLPIDMVAKDQQAPGTVGVEVGLPQVVLDEDQERKEKLKRDYRELGRSYIGMRLKGQPIGRKLIDASAKLDHSMMSEPLDSAQVCASAFAEGLGIDLADSGEDLSSDRVNFLKKIPETDPYMVLMVGVMGGKTMTYALGLFMKAIADTHSPAQLVSLGEYLTRPENNTRIERNRKVRSANVSEEDLASPTMRNSIVEWIESGNMPSRSVFSIRGIIRVYAGWMVQSYQPTKPV